MNWKDQPTNKAIMKGILDRRKAHKQNEYSQVSEFEVDRYYDRFLKKYDTE